MNKLLVMPILLVLMTILIPIIRVDASDESSYQYGYLSGSQTAPDSGLKANSYQESDNCGLTNASVSSALYATPDIMFQD